jgi:hypothetical protein
MGHHHSFFSIFRICDKFFFQIFLCRKQNNNTKLQRGEARTKHGAGGLQSFLTVREIFISHGRVMEKRSCRSGVHIREGGEGRD